jgi:hypothetical protein
VTSTKLIKELFIFRKLQIFKMALMQISKEIRNKNYAKIGSSDEVTPLSLLSGAKVHFTCVTPIHVHMNTVLRFNTMTIQLVDNKSVI